MKHKIALVIALVIMAGCSSKGPLSPTTPPSAIDTLLSQAQEQERLGHLPQAVALVERALRIEPRDAQAWYQLARLYQARGDHTKARQFARRSIQFATGDQALIRANQRLIDTLD